MNDGCKEPGCRLPVPSGWSWCREHNPDRCTDVTTSGRRCRNEVIPGRNVCAGHAGNFSFSAKREKNDAVVDFLKEHDRMDLAGIVIRIRAELRRYREAERKAPGRVSAPE